MFTRSSHSVPSAVCFLAAFALIAVCPVLAQPGGYYDTVDMSDPSALRSTLHDVIDDHTKFPYTSTDPDTWDIVNLADEDPNDTGRIVDVYKNASYAKIPGGVGAYNREHVWPKSFGFPNDGDDNYPYTDAHHLFAADATYNSTRSNKPFRWCDASCEEWTTDLTDGRGGGSGLYPGNSNWTAGSFSTGTWETWDGRKGDVARAIFYMDVRYEGGSHGVTGYAEPDLRLTDDDVVIDSYRTGSNEPVAYMGLYSVLLQWHQEDPVDAREIWRNEAVYTFQGNRNPFIDHPEFVDCLYLGQCNGSGDVTPPVAPTGLAATAGDGSVMLDWDDNTEPDLAGYNVYRGASAGGPYTKLNGAYVGSSLFTDSQVTNDTTYYYVVAAVDGSSNISADSNEASATPTGGSEPPPGGGTGSLVLSEVVYDVSSTDDGYEWVEIFNSGQNAVDLSGWSLGNGGTDYTYSLVQLSGTLASGETFVVGGPTSGSINGNPVYDQVVNFSPDFQNSGSAGDGVALFDVPANQVTASTVPFDAVVYGPDNANGLIDETGTANPPEVGDASAGSSIERVDLAGSWQIQSVPTPNSSPLAGGPPANSAPTASFINSCSDLGCFFDGSGSSDSDGSIVSWSWDFGDGATAGGDTAGHAYAAAGSYTVSLTVTDDDGATDSTSQVVTVSEPSTAGAVHVDAIDMGVRDGGKGQKYPRAWVTVVDDTGTPVSGATVSGTFSGDASGSASATTGSDGVALLEIGPIQGRTKVDFCVDDVADASLPYDPGANVETCASL